MTFSLVAIIYNPHSTGDSKGSAQKLRTIVRKAIGTPVKLLPTTHAGHAETLAYDLARQNPKPLIISASGDGGYHEVINGALRAQAEGHLPICAVLPTGNANDHARSLHTAPLAELIKKGAIRKLDVLEMEIHHTTHVTRRYAHAYIGFGVTPAVADELNKHDLNMVVEAWTVLRSLLSFTPIRIRIDNRDLKLDSLVCSTIPFMAKVLTIDKQSKPNDGLFEVAAHEHASKLALLTHLARGTVHQLAGGMQYQQLKFDILRATKAQLDGELLSLPKGAKVTIRCKKQLLRTLI